MGDGYGPMLVSKTKVLPGRSRCARRIAVPGTHDQRFSRAATLAGQAGGASLIFIVVPFDQIFAGGALRTQADVGLIIHEGQLTYQNEGLVVCEDLGVWWGRENEGLPLPLGGNVIHKRFAPEVRKKISDTLTASIQFSLDHRDRGGATRAAIRPRHGPRTRRPVRGHVCEPLDARLRREGPRIHPPLPAPRLRARVDSARAGAGVCGLSLGGRAAFRPLQRPKLCRAGGFSRLFSRLLLVNSEAA